MKRQRTDGVRHLQDILDRCTVDEDTGCWHWQGAMSRRRNGAVCPHVALAPGVVGKDRVSTSASRAAFILSGRKAAGLKVWRTCGCLDCCNPQHMKVGTKAEEGAWLASAGVLRGHPHRSAAGKRAASWRTVPAEKVARVLELIDGGMPAEQVAEEVSLHKATISRIRNGRHISQRMQTVSAACVFAWRPAA